MNTNNQKPTAERSAEALAELYYVKPRFIHTPSWTELLNPFFERGEEAEGLLRRIVKPSTERDQADAHAEAEAFLSTPGAGEGSGDASSKRPDSGMLPDISDQRAKEILNQLNIAKTI